MISWSLLFSQWDDPAQRAEFLGALRMADKLNRPITLVVKRSDKKIQGIEMRVENDSAQTPK